MMCIIFHKSMQWYGYPHRGLYMIYQSPGRLCKFTLAPGQKVEANVDHRERPDVCRAAVMGVFGHALTGLWKLANNLRHVRSDDTGNSHARMRRARSTVRRIRPSIRVEHRGTLSRFHRHVPMLIHPLLLLAKEIVGCLLDPLPALPLRLRFRWGRSRPHGRHGFKI